MMSAALMGGGAGVGLWPLLAADAAFDVVFGVFLVAFAVLVVVTVRWAVRRDRAGRAEWLRRQQGAGKGGAQNAPPTPTNGHVPRRKDQHGGNPRRPG